MKTKIYLSCSLLLIGLLAFSQVKMEKDYDESFEATEGNKVEVLNKYGEVIINTWQESNVRFVVKVTARGRNQEVVNKTMNRVNVDIRKIGHLISVDMDIERKRGTFTELLGGVEDYSKALFGNQKLTVNMEVWLPEDIDLSINNRYGDVYLASLGGELDVTLAHGDLKAERIDGRIEMEHSFGKSSFDYINRGKFNLRGVETTVDEGSTMSFQSSSSDIDLTNIHYVKLNSRNDKVRVRNVNEIVGIGRFTELDAEQVMRNVDLNFNFGEILLSQLDQKFKTVNLVGKSTDINLVLNQASYVKTSIKGDESKMIVPNSMMSLSRDYDSETEVVKLSGMLGPTQTFQSVLNVDADGGDVIISIKETPIFTDRR